MALLSTYLEILTLQTHTIETSEFTGEMELETQHSKNVISDTPKNKKMKT